MSRAQEASGTTGVSAWQHIRSVLLLPFMNAVLIPGLILLLARDQRLADGGLALTVAALGLLLVVAGLVLVVRAVALFVRIGRGTLAPWDPTRALITTGVYAFSRNPMKAGLFLVLLGECLVSGSRALMVWATAFFIANVVYIRWFEERGLERRFGPAYRAYCERVPRWPGLRVLRRAPRAAESAP
jgi:protein-S-isoprenylcysteine O-methyltransferase Ste14